MINFLQFLIDHWKQLGLMATAVGSVLAHLYVVIWHAGGLRTIKRNIMGPPDKETPKQ